MRWQKAARLAVALIGVGTAIAIYVLTRERPVANRPSVSTAADPTASVQTGGGKTLRYSGSRLIGTLEFASSSQYEDGRSRFENFKYTLDDGTVISAGLVETTGKTAKGEPDEFKLTKQVRFQRSDGTGLQGEAATFNETSGIANVPGAASFTRGRMSGSGTGGIYERDSGTIKLLADTKVKIAPEEAGAPPIDATSVAMTFLRADKSMLFDQNALIARAAETLAADRATLFLSEDEQRFRAIELRGNSKVMPLPGKTSDLPDMRADDIDLTFYDNSSALQKADLQRRATMVLTNEQGRRSIEAPHIAFATAADGKTLTQLDAGDRVTVKTPPSAGVPERMISASTLAAKGNDKVGLTNARFDGRVEFVEMLPAAQGQPASKRTGNSQVLVMEIKGQLDAIDTARFERDVRFVSGDIQADADVGVYRAAKGELDLQPLAVNARKPPHVDDGSVTVDAAEIITVDLNTNNLYARRTVKTLSRSTGAQPSAGSAIFNSKDPILGSGAEFWYDAAKKSVTYNGATGAPARLTQLTNVVIGTKIVFFQEKQDLTATGAVESTFLMDPAPDKPGDKPAGKPAAKPASYHMTANSLSYSDAERTAKYGGSPATLTRPDGTTSANTLVLVFAKASRTLDRLDALDDVRTTLQGDREAFGASLTYLADKDLYTLEGKPLTLITKDEEGTCSIQTGSFMTFDTAVGAPDFPMSRNQTAPIRSKQPCPRTPPVKK